MLKPPTSFCWVTAASILGSWLPIYLQSTTNILHKCYTTVPLSFLAIGTHLSHHYSTNVQLISARIQFSFLLSFVFHRMVIGSCRNTEVRCSNGADSRCFVYPSLDCKLRLLKYDGIFITLKVTATAVVAVASETSSLTLSYSKK